MSCPSYTPSHCQDTDALFQIYAVSGPRLVGRAAGPAVIAFQLWSPPVFQQKCCAGVLPHRMELE